MFNADLQDPQAVLDAALEISGSEILVADARARVVACSDGMATLLGAAPAALRPGEPVPDVVALARGRASVCTVAVHGQQVAYVVRTLTADLAAFEALRRECQALRETLDSLDATVAVYDADLCFVRSNRAYHDFFPQLPDDSALHGRHYGEQLGMMLNADRLPEPVPREQRPAVIAERVHKMRDCVPPHEHFDRQKGRWFLLRVSPTPDGGRVALRVDIDPQKQLQKKLLWDREAATATVRALRAELEEIRARLVGCGAEGTTPAAPEPAKR